MLDARDPLSLVRHFFANFGPTVEEMIETAQRYCHDDLSWASGGFDPPRVQSLRELAEDLQKAKSAKGVGGFTFVMVHAAADGPYVLTERLDDSTDLHGNLLHSYKVMGTVKVEDGRIRWVRDYYYDTREFVNYLPEDLSRDSPKVLDALMRAGD